MNRIDEYSQINIKMSFPSSTLGKICILEDEEQARDSKRRKDKKNTKDFMGILGAKADT